MTNLIKVKASAEEIPQIISLAREIWLPTFARYFSEKELNSLFSGMYNPEKLKATLENPNYSFHIVETLGQEKVGYYATERKSDHLKLDKIYVAQNLQGTGIGKWIYQEILKEAAAINASSIQLNVNRRNTPAIDFYLKLGFKIIRSEDIPGPNGFIYDDYVMEAVVADE